MTAVTFDTLAYAKRLMGAGFTEEQAQALADAQAQAFSQMLATGAVATKADIARLEMHLARMEKQMAEMETRIMKSVANLLYGFAGVIIAAIAAAAVWIK